MIAGEAAGQPSFEEDLRQIGLEAEWVRTAVGDGNRERTRALGNQHALSAQGFYAWNGILASLTLIVQDFDWERQDPQCLPILIQKNKKNILFVSTGDEYTGVTGTGKYPRSRNPKGTIVRALAQQNKALLREPLPLDIPESTEQQFMKQLIGYTTYVLLVHFSKRDCEARYEVSRLDDLDSKGYLSTRFQRLIAPVYPLTAGDFDADDPNEGFDGPGDYEVPPKS